jgi:hypothetical protein
MSTVRDARLDAAWKAAGVAELDRVAAQGRWGFALMLIGWIHLAAFLVCEAMHVSGILTNSYYAVTWILELVSVVLVIRIVAGRGWYRATPLAGILVRVWVTFLILSFNLTSLNTLTGLEHTWFKAPLATLSTFGFAATAYLVNPRFFIPAVQMYFTGLLMALSPSHAYVIYGVAWWLALQVIGVVLERRRHRVIASFCASDRAYGSELTATTYVLTAHPVREMAS